MAEKKSAEQRRQENLERLAEMCLLDDLLMSKCFEGDVTCIQLVLRIVLEMPDLRVLEATTQRVLSSLNRRSVRLDILAVDGEGRIYNIEVQREDAGANEKRARFHSSKLDTMLLEKGKPFEELPETYVIFITEHDVLRKGWPVYRIERCILGAEERFVDGSHIVYVNGAYRDETPIGKLMADFACRDPERMHYKPLADRVKYFKEDGKGTAIMCKAMQENFEEGIEIGREEGIEIGQEKVALNMLRRGSLPIDEIAKMAGLPIDRIIELKAELEKEEWNKRGQSKPGQWLS